MDHGYPHDLWRLHGPQTSTWLQMAAWNINVHGIWQQHRPWASTWPLVATWTIDIAMIPVAAWIMDIHMVSGGSKDDGHQSAWPAAGARITDTSTAFGGSLDHGDLLRRLNPGSEPLISDILLLRDRAIMWLRSMFGGRAYESSRLLHILLPLFLNYICWNTVLTILCH